MFENPTPASRRFQSKFPGTCAWSGTRYGTFEPMVRLLDGYIPETKTEINPHYVRVLFIEMGCDRRWMKRGEYDLDTITGQNVRFLTVNKYGEIKGVFTIEDGRCTYPGSHGSRSLAQMRRSFESAVGLKILVKMSWE